MDYTEPLCQSWNTFLVIKTLQCESGRSLFSSPGAGHIERSEGFSGGILGLILSAPLLQVDSQGFRLRGILPFIRQQPPFLHNVTMETPGGSWLLVVGYPYLTFHHMTSTTTASFISLFSLHIE